MKLASLKGGRDGRLVVVSDDLTRWADASPVAPTLQAALDDWASAEPRLRALEVGPDAPAFDPATAAAPLPRTHNWSDGSVYLNHMELVRRARGAEMPESFLTDPLIYQGGGDDLLGPCDPVRFADESWGIDIEAEVAVIVDDVPMGTDADAAPGHIKLVLLANDWSLRNLIPGELAKGFGFYCGKPATAFSAVAVTPDALGDLWDGRKLHGAMETRVDGELLGRPDAGKDMNFDFAELIAHAARTRNLGAGTIIGSGTVSNRDRATGSTCIAEVRMIETIETGTPTTPFLTFGQTVRMELVGSDGSRPFGAIEQKVVGYG